MCNGAWSTCSTGHSQSPISIPTSTAIQDHNIAVTSLRFKSVFATAFNRTGLPSHVEVSVPSNDACMFGGPKGGYHYLWKLSFHSPSEHAFDDFRASASAQFWFRDAKGNPTYTLGMMFTDNTNVPNPWIDSVLAAMRTNSSKIDLNPTSVLPTDLSYYFYSGSDTVPPCQEVWTWMILRAPAQLTLDQVAAIRSWQGGADHIRPIQPLNGRNVTLEYSHIVVEEDPNTFVAIVTVLALISLVGGVIAIIVNRQATEILNQREEERRAYLATQRQH